MRFWVSAAERAAAKAEGTEAALEIAKWARQIRGDFGLTPGALEAGRESEYVKRRSALGELLKKHRAAEAKQAAAELAADFPNMPGTDAVVCWLDVSGHDHARAVEDCRRAVEIEPRSVKLRVLMAYAAFGAKKPALAIPHLEEALALDPRQKDVWSLLEAAYRSSGEEERLIELRGRYLKRFGERLR